MPWVSPHVNNALHLPRTSARGGAASCDSTGNEWLRIHCFVVCRDATILLKLSQAANRPDLLYRIPALAAFRRYPCLLTHHFCFNFHPHTPEAASSID